MAEHKVQLPDNSVITIEGPEDATDQELIDAATQHYANKQSKNSGPINAIKSAVESGVNAVLDSDAMTYGAGAAAVAAGIPLAKKLKDKFFGGTEAPPRIEPQMDVSTGGPKEPYLEPDKPPPPPPPSTPKSWEESLSAADRELLEKSKANAAAKAQSAPAPAPIPEPPAFIRNQPPAPISEAPANPKIPALLQAPAGAVAPPVVAPAPVAAPVVAPMAAAPTPVAPAPITAPTLASAPVGPTTTQTPNEKILETIKSTAQSSLGKPDLVTGTGMPAYQGQGAEGSKPAHKKGVFESIKQIPKEYVFVPTGQNMDIVRNAVGQPEYTKNLKSFGGYPESPQAAYEQSRNINKSLGRATMAEAKASGIPLPEPTPSITQKIAGSKTVKVAGVTGALILASDLASAAQEGVTAAKEGDRQMATGYLTDIIGALTGPVGFTASQLFGTSPEDLRTLRTAEQARKVGAGRGVVPPSAYQR